MERQTDRQTDWQKWLTPRCFHGFSTTGSQTEKKLRLYVGSTIAEWRITVRLKNSFAYGPVP